MVPPGVREESRLLLRLLGDGGPILDVDAAEVMDRFEASISIGDSLWGPDWPSSANARALPTAATGIPGWYERS